MPRRIKASVVARSDSVRVKANALSDFILSTLTSYSHPNGQIWKLEK